MKSVISLSSLSLATDLYPASSNVAVFPTPDFPDDEEDDEEEDDEEEDEEDDEEDGEEEDEEDDDPDCGEELDLLLLKLARLLLSCGDCSECDSVCEVCSKLWLWWTRHG